MMGYHIHVWTLSVCNIDAICELTTQGILSNIVQLILMWKD